MPIDIHYAISVVANRQRSILPVSHVNYSCGAASRADDRRQKCTLRRNNCPRGNYAIISISNAVRRRNSCWLRGARLKILAAVQSQLKLNRCKHEILSRWFRRVGFINRECLLTTFYRLESKWSIYAYPVSLSRGKYFITKWYSRRANALTVATLRNMWGMISTEIRWGHIGVYK